MGPRPSVLFSTTAPKLPQKPRHTPLPVPRPTSVQVPPPRRLARPGSTGRNRGLGEGSKPFLPRRVTFRRQVRACCSRLHSSALAPQRRSISFALDSSISSKASSVSSWGISWGTGETQKGQEESWGSWERVSTHCSAGQASQLSGRSQLLAEPLTRSHHLSGTQAEHSHPHPQQGKWRATFVLGLRGGRKHQEGLDGGSQLLPLSLNSLVQKSWEL